MTAVYFWIYRKVAKSMIYIVACQGSRVTDDRFPGTSGVPALTWIPANMTTIPAWFDCLIPPDLDRHNIILVKLRNSPICLYEIFMPAGVQNHFSRNNFVSFHLRVVSKGPIINWDQWIILYKWTCNPFGLTRWTYIIKHWLIIAVTFQTF